MQSRKARTAAQQVHNHTPYTLDTIQALPLLGHTISTWRQRRTHLYAHPPDTTLLVSSGVTFAGSMRVLAVEPRSTYETALDYIAHGKVYISA